MISIIIPVYNVASYIEACIKSVMRQTYSGVIECLIVDDRGTDESIAIAGRMIEAYDGPIQFQILYHEQNRGLSAARNTGTEAAKGEYVYYLDSDDEITEDCIQKLLMPVLQDPTIEMVQGNSTALVKEHQSSLVISNENVRECFYHKHQLLVYAWNKLIKRSFLTQNKLSFKEGILWEDSYWLFFLLKRLKNVYFIPDVTYLHKNRPGSIMTSTSKRTIAIHRAKFYHDVLTNLTPHDERSEMRYIFPQFAHFYTRFHMELPEYDDLFSLFYGKTKEYGFYGLKVRLAFCCYVGRSKYGWVLIQSLKRLQHPHIIREDLQRLRRGW